MQAPDFLAHHASHIESVLAAILDRRASAVPATLLAAMRYSLLAGGKRIRPALLLECFAACSGKDAEQALPAAASIESLHTYSLIHDDLPCMDDDDLRRGMPTCHKKFDEATAVLAADALQALSFELLAELNTSADTRIELVRRLAIAAGGQGMVGGQQLDIEGDGQQIDDVLQVERIHLHKTGALLCYACEAGAILAGANEAELDACSRYGKAVGLLFQIADDILDATADAAALGKTAGKDAAQNKATYVSVLGLPKARELAGEMRDLAVEALAPLGKRAGHLQQLADYILERGR
ncbi:MAG TPA: farnesyl diphosphate synthase [Mariprofundaceae bacterium]|nr:farnesyl diphosphate synthase [Mariprofundaceae bacterium]